MQISTNTGVVQAIGKTEDKPEVAHFRLSFYAGTFAVPSQALKNSTAYALVVS
jgi:hypothetical protein